MVVSTKTGVQPNRTETSEPIVGRYEAYLEREAKETVCGNAV